MTKLYFKNIKTFILILSSASLFSACATINKTETESYMTEVMTKLKPVMKEALRKQVKALADQGQKPMSLPPPDNGILLYLAISKDGKIKDVRILKKSKYTFLNEIARDSILQASPLTQPPESCLKENICELRWKLILE